MPPSEAVEEALWRVGWALPIVIVVGALVVLAIRQATRRGALREPKPRLVAVERWAASPETAVHLFEVDGRQFLLVDSTHPTRLVELASPGEPAAAWPSVRRMAFRPLAPRK